MRRRVIISWGLGLLLTFAIGSAGCAGGSSSEAGTEKDPLAGYPQGPTREFIMPGGDNTVQEYGREATSAERKQASAVVEAWLRARVAGRWGKACSYLHEKVKAFAVRLGTEVSEGGPTTCAKALAGFSRNDEPPRNNIKGGIASLRIESGAGFAQYHGKGGRDWILAVRKEDGNWKIADFRPLERLK